MKTFEILVIVMIATIIALPQPAQADTGGLAIGVANEHIDVTVGFTGSSIEIFGDRRDKNSNIAIVIEGPEKNITLWQKARVMGTWVNRHFVYFENIPSYYHYAISTGQKDEKLSNVMLENGIGHEALFHRINEKRTETPENIETFQQALLRKNKNLGVFFEQPAEITFLNDNFFRVRFDISPSAPTGEYKIHSFLIKDGKVAERRLNMLKVEQVGINAFMYRAAHEHSAIYAMICIAFALFSGWLAGALRVKP